MKKNDKIYIAGHTGLVGSSLIRHLNSTLLNFVKLSDGEDFGYRDNFADKFCNFA